MHWVSEDLCPYSIVNDRVFKSLMKMGRPDHYIPLPSTVSHDMRLVFAQTRQHVATMLRVSKWQCGMMI